MLERFTTVCEVSTRRIASSRDRFQRSPAVSCVFFVLIRLFFEFFCSLDNSRMLPTSRPAYRFGDDKENVPLDIKSSRYSESLPSSIWGTDEIFNIWKTPALVTPLSDPKNIDYVQTKTYLNPFDSAESHSPHSSGYGSFSASPWSQESFKIFADELSRPIDDLFKPSGSSLVSDEASCSSMSSSSLDSSISYSLLSSCAPSDNGSPKRLAEMTFEGEA